MPQDRVDKLLDAYFNQPYDQYGEFVLQIRENGGLSSDEVRAIEGQVLYVDANTMIRHSGTTEKRNHPAAAR